MLHWLLARLFPRFVPKALATTQETAPLSQELTVAYAARSADVQSLRELDETMVEQWAITQSARMQAGSTIIEHVPWWYPVHPVAIAYFMERGWWSPSDIEKHALLPMYDMLSSRFGGDLGTFFQRGDYTKMDRESISSWSCGMMARFVLSTEARASFLGHTLVSIGPNDWLVHVWPACAKHCQGIELDVLFAVCSVALPQAIALQMSPTLNDALRSVTPPNMWDALATQDTPYVLSANHPHFPLRYLLETSPVWSCLDLYRLGVRLKHLERSEVDSCALPSGVYGNAFGLGS